MAARPDPRTLVAPPAVRVSGIAPPPAPAAVRMDVAAFVGRVKPTVPPTPLPPPAAVESAEAFAAAFAEAPDSRLGPAVRAFFRNGGRRCWIVPADPPFLDTRLKATGAAALVREAATLDDGPPTGVHAVLALEEVTLLAVPDAFPPRAAPAAPVRDTAVAAPPGGPAAPPPGFSACKVVDPAVLDLTFELAPKKLAGALATDPPVRVWLELAWTWAPSSSDQETAKTAAKDAARAGARFVLVRSASQAFPPNETETVYRGTAAGMVVGTKPAIYSVSVGTEPAFYRVRAETAALTGGWADPVEQALPSGQIVPTEEAPIATQIAAVQVCAARGDVIAVLAPPENWPTITDDEWLRLRTMVTADAVAKGDWIGLLRKSDAWNAADKLALQTHAAFWGPWVLARDGETADAEPDAYPADGAVCGLLARRALERGAWASILNLPVAGALGLGPTPYGPGALVPLFAAEADGATRAASDSREAVTGRQAQGVNVLARTPRGFVPVGERTPPPDPNRDTAFPSDVVPVRRFMALLRRELARVGVGLAFAPNGPALERRAVRAVESVLENLLRRGALVGPDARSSFQVTARAGEPAAGADNRLEVEIRVRPALPLRLLTLRLVRTGGDAFTIAEGQG